MYVLSEEYEAPKRILELVGLRNRNDNDGEYDTTTTTNNTGNNNNEQIQNDGEETAAIISSDAGGDTQVITRICDDSGKNIRRLFHWVGWH